MAVEQCIISGQGVMRALICIIFTAALRVSAPTSVYRHVGEDSGAFLCLRKEAV